MLDCDLWSSIFIAAVTTAPEGLFLSVPSDDVLCLLHFLVCVQEDEMHRQTALRLISVIGYSLSLSSLTIATLMMGMLR